MEELVYKKKSSYELAPEKTEAAFAFAKDYMRFLDSSKTEREAVETSIAAAEAAGFTPYKLGDAVKVGDRRYLNNRGKSLILFRVGSESLNCGVRITAAHIDSPRIDLKQQPLYEADGMAFFKTHYYGGLRKYQWTAIPLALHGVVVRADGESASR